MIPRMLQRASPALGTVALLALAAAAPAPRQTGPAPPSQAAATCDPFSQTGGGASSYNFGSSANDDGILQPFPDGLPLAICSLQVAATGWNSANVRMLEWDPLTLAPDPQAIALRSAFCDPSDLNYYTINALPRFTFVPPIVTQSLAGVADPPRSQVAMQVYDRASLNYSFNGNYEPNGDPSMPAALTFGGLPALTGPHPVAAHALCDGGAVAADLRVLQAVNRTDSEAPLGQHGYLQRFRVPEAVELRWVEVEVDEGAQIPGTLTVSIIDAAGFAQPPIVLPSPLAQASLQTWFYKQPGPRWAAPVDLDHTVTLQPGRDYWLSLSSAQGYKYRTHTRTATENASFTYAIGSFHHRALPGDAWTELPSQALSFKLVGRSHGSPLTVQPRDGILLSVTPNPAQAAPEVAWSGATGPVKVEVFDARGRRVATGGGGAAGRWAVQARDARPLAAGVYFVHAKDSEGASAVERLVIVR